MTAMFLPGKHALALAALLAVLLPQQTPPPLSDAPKEKPAPPVRVAVERLKPEATLEVPGTRGLGFGDGTLWVSEKETSRAIRVDLKTNKTTQAIALGKAPCPGMTFGFGAMWVPLCGNAGIARVDPKTNLVTATISKGITSVSGPMVTGVSSLWALIDDKGTLARIDPVANTVVAEVYTNTGGSGASGASGVAFGQSAIWVSNRLTHTLVRIDAYTNLIVEWIKVGKAPIAVAFGEGSVWTLNAGDAGGASGAPGAKDATVSRVDPKTNKVTDTVKLGMPAVTGGQLAVGEGSVWISAPGVPLVRIDPRTNQVAQIFTGLGGGLVFVSDGSLWIAADAKTLWRLDPKRIEATR